MRQKIMHCIRILLAALLLSGCAVEEIPNSPHSSGPHFRYISLSELQQNPFAYNELRKLQAKSGSQSRLLYNTEYGFCIDTDAILLIEKDGYRSYTFPIYRENAGLKTENLVLSFKNNNEFEAYITKYLLSETDKEKIKNNQPVNLAGKTEAELLERTGGDPNRCYEMVRMESYVDEHGQLVASYVVVYEVPCPSGGSGGSSGGSSSSGSNGASNGSGSGNTGSSGGNPGSSGTGGMTGGGGGGSGNNPPANPNPGGDPANIADDPIITYPVILTDHIRELNSITNKPEVKERLNQLRQTNTTATEEEGSEYFTPDTPTEPLIREDIPGESTGVQFGDVYENSILRIHSHHPGLEPVFSAQDINGMAAFFRDKRNMQAPDAQSVSSVLISTLGIFALRVTDPVKAKLFANKLVNSTYTKALINRYEEDVRNKSLMQCNCLLPSIQYEQLLSDNLIKFLKNEDTGLTLFSANSIEDNFVWAEHPMYN